MISAMKLSTEMGGNTSTETTRQKILNIAAEEMHLHGFQSCSLSAILHKADISKGALYHHFANKQALGYAVVEEVFAPKLLAMWQPVFDSDDPKAAMVTLFRDVLTCSDTESISVGCPINNLAQEMSPIDEGFRLRISDVIQQWQAGLEQVLKQGQEQGNVGADIDPTRTAIFLIASIEGGCGLAKNAQDIEMFSSCIYGLIDYVERL